MIERIRNWLYWDLPDEMQRKMLLNVHSNRPSLANFVRRSVKNWRRTAAADAVYRASQLEILTQRGWPEAGFGYDDRG